MLSFCAWQVLVAEVLVVYQLCHGLVGRVCVPARKVSPHGQLQLLWNRRHSAAPHTPPGSSGRQRDARCLPLPPPRGQPNTGAGKEGLISEANLTGCLSYRGVSHEFHYGRACGIPH